MEIFVFILVAVAAVIALLSWLGNKSSSSNLGPYTTRQLAGNSEDEDFYDDELPSTSVTFIQINQFINFGGSYRDVAAPAANIPRLIVATPGFKAKGMQSYYHGFKRVLLRNRLTPGHEYSAVVTLQIDPTNRFDPFAVMVIFQGHTLAYVPREDSQAFYSVLKPVGGAAICVANIWFDPRYRRGGKRNSIRLMTSTLPQLER